jgi:hypothetical protein
LCYKIEESNGPQWEHTDSIMIAWKSRIRRDSTDCTIKIPANQITIIRDSIATYGSGESYIIWHVVGTMHWEITLMHEYTSMWQGKRSISMFLFTWCIFKVLYSCLGLFHLSFLKCISNRWMHFIIHVSLSPQYVLYVGTNSI